MMMWHTMPMKVMRENNVLAGGDAPRPAGRGLRGIAMTVVAAAALSAGVTMQATASDGANNTPTGNEHESANENDRATPKGPLSAPGVPTRVQRDATHRAPMREDGSVVGTFHGPGAFTVWSIDQPNPEADPDPNAEPHADSHASAALASLGQRYAMVCTISADEVQGQAYLEMVSTIDGREYFTRTTGHAPMQPITGSLDSATLVLPFETLDEAKRPTRIALRIVMPAQGTITVHSAALGAITKAEMAMLVRSADGGAWWSGRASGLIGGIAGSLIGIIGGIVGVLASRGAARSTAMTLMGVVVAIGAIGLCVGVAALAMRQPYAVWYPAMLMGVLCLTIGPVMLVTIRKRYEAHELGRMAALDAG